MEHLANAMQEMTQSFANNIIYLMFILGVLWSVQIVNVLLHYRLNYLGILPRTSLGLIGIFCSPFLHGSFDHLFFNSIPLFVLSNFVLMRGIDAFIQITAFIIVVSGLGTWLVGRKALHVGASSVIMGYFSYLLFNAYKDPTLISIVLAVVSLYYFGAMFASLFPTDEKSSFEGHICGFIAGGLATLIWV